MDSRARSLHDIVPDCRECEPEALLLLLLLLLQWQAVEMKV